LRLSREPFDSPTAKRLVAELVEDMRARYDGEDGAGAYPVAEDFVAFLVAWAGNTAVGCGGVTRFDGTTVEVKRMYVVPAARGRGVSRLLLAELEVAARAAGYARAVLETGHGQPEAVGLYRSAGYEEIACWRPYADDPRSVCLAKEL
jgi:GNAT superfamily N-acetyltransferase